MVLLRPPPRVFGGGVYFCVVVCPFCCEAMVFVALFMADTALLNGPLPWLRLYKGMVFPL
ncbi:hypothetical protein [uncultured Desulfovibrio sp.]|uniref:hypothetical protein n=1 Tax=uncultured Desulfovibrio sp. TaxID=167968 RepID=UPI00262F018A|nr:hypothetical protein [uncultured Desulfovibrio sp.]